MQLPRNSRRALHPLNISASYIGVGVGHQIKSPQDWPEAKLPEKNIKIKIKTGKRMSYSKVC